MNHAQPTHPDVALIIEGGGMRGAYTAAVVSKLINEGIDTGWVGGISAGASHTSNYLSRDAERARYVFTEFAAQPQFGGWGSFARRRGYFNSQYIYDEATKEDIPLDYEAFLNHPAEMHIEATRADTGETIAWNRTDTPTEDDLNIRVRASSTLPIVMNVPYIDEVPFVDGALGSSGGLLIDAAEQAGYKKFLVIMSRPRDYFKKTVSRPGMVRRALRRWPAVAEAEIARPPIYNAAKKRILELEASGKAKVFFPISMPVSVGEMNVEKLKAAYNAGAAQIEAEWAGFEQFLNS